MTGRREQMPKRILMTADTVGGVWTYAVELSKALKESGVQVALATMGLPVTAEQHKEAARAGNIELFESSFKLEWMDNPWDDIIRSGEWLLCLEERISPDIIHLNGYAHAALPWHAPRLVVGHSCVFSWWEAVKGELPPPSWNRYKAAVAQGLNSADCVVAPTKTMLTALYRNYAFTSAGIVVPNGSDPEVFFPSPKDHFVIAAGRLWDEAKNIGALRAVAANIEWPVYVAGDEHCCGNKTVITDRVYRLGRLSTRQLAVWFSRAAIYVLPAFYEPFGLSVLEAALSGCALVLGDIPSLREIWQNTALFVPPADTDALRETVSFLIRNPRHRKEMSARASTRALSFTSGQMAKRYGEVYRMLLNNKVRHARERIA